MNFKYLASFKVSFLLYSTFLLLNHDLNYKIPFKMVFPSPMSALDSPKLRTAAGEILDVWRDNL